MMNSKLKEVAQVFFKLGCFAFGGPAAHIAMMEEEIVRKRQWMNHEHFLDLMGATNLIPGPNSTEMTMHCGHERAGSAGLFVAGICFIFPAVLITGVFAYLYQKYGTVPAVASLIYGIKPAVLVVILSAVIKLGKKALKGWELGILGLAVLAAALLGINEIVALLAAGVIGALYFYTKHNLSADKLQYVLLWISVPLGSAVVTTVSATTVFWTFLKVGAVLYGSGYVLFAYLDAELVSQGWLTRSELLDAIAVGQFTPGPVLSTSTFIGYQLSGFWGAIAATAGIFLPSFLFTLLLNPLVPKMRSSKLLGYFLDSVNIAALAVMVAVLIVMGQESLTDWRAIAILCAALTFTYGPYKLNAMWLIAGGGILGYLLLLF